MVPCVFRSSDVVLMVAVGKDKGGRIKGEG